MKVRQAILACAVVGTAWFVGMDIEAGRDLVRQEAAGRIGRATPTPTATRVTRAIATPDAPSSTRRMTTRRVSSAAMRRLITERARGTYVREVLIERDSAIARWPEHTTRPLRVYVGDGGTLDGWTLDYVHAVRDAFDSWSRTGIPMRFSYVVDSTMADVTVRFIDRFAEGISGKTVWSRDGDHWLLSGDIQLSLTHPAGGFVSEGQMRAIALHEVGHLLGLDHTTSAEHIMSPRVRVRDLSDGDRATVRLIYSVPAGSLR